MYRASIPRSGAMTLGAFRRLIHDGMADFTHRADAPENLRVAHCRICRTAIARSAGRGYDEYMRDGYRFVRRYVCAECFAKLGEDKL
mgnify:CR=1 FL=1